MTDRYPGYDVLDKRVTPSWDAQTRRTIDERLAAPRIPRFFSDTEWHTADAICRRILPQPDGRDEVPLVALLDAKLLADRGDGFRIASMPYMQEAWRRGLAATDADARARHDGSDFVALTAAEQDALLGLMQQGALRDAAWDGLGAEDFFKMRLLVDIPGLYYSHPIAWSEIGFGGPASPRGYVRMALNRRDPWEAAETKPGGDASARRENRHVV